MLAGETDLARRPFHDPRRTLESSVIFVLIRVGGVTILGSQQLTLAVRWLVRQYKLARKQFPTRGDKAMRVQSIRGRMELDGFYVPIQAHCPAAEEAGAESNRGQSTVGKYLSAFAPKADMPHRQQRLTERAGKGPGSIRHGRRSRVDVEIRSLSFVWAVCAW